MIEKYSKFKVGGKDFYWVVVGEIGDSYMIHQINSDTIELKIISKEKVMQTHLEKEKDYEKALCFKIQDELLKNNEEIPREVAKELKKELK